MASGASKSVLCVESIHDQYVVINLMMRHGVPWNKDAHAVQLKSCTNDTGVLNAIRDEVPAAKGSGRAVGFILDIDTTPETRWKKVAEALRLAGMTPPDQLAHEGYIEESIAFNMRVGVWLMPDNKLHQGDLEDFLKTLLPANDALYSFADLSTGNAVSNGAKFANPKDRKKANLHCWLAWQKEPGEPYGQAINFKYFESDSPVALSFVDWFKSLYQLK